MKNIIVHLYVCIFYICMWCYVADKINFIAVNYVSVELNNVFVNYNIY